MRWSSRLIAQLTTTLNRYDRFLPERERAAGGMIG
jgi:hypothetical protein